MSPFLLVKCPRCSHEMKCAPRRITSSSRKRCVYCGSSFKIENNIVKVLSDSNGRA